ncbi:HAD family hydrolase [Promineifilum sp.]|uniref:HAD family hydrolase n=1 Tax=Promineifilum sp. TaxID=2664178 RepID=UPI0035AEA971
MLPSWNPTPTRQAILDFLAAVTEPDSPDYAPLEARLAVFDNDGTLWVEKPYLVHFYALVARYREMLRHQPLRLTRRAARALLTNDTSDADSIFQRSELAELLGDMAGVPFSGMTDDEFAAWMRAWIEQWRHPRFGVSLAGLVYRPMVELIALLHSLDFTVVIATADEAAFVRLFSAELFGVPPLRVLGSSFAPRPLAAGAALDPLRLLRGHHPDFFHHGEDKPRCVEREMGRRPLLAAGNSDGDLPLLRWTAEGPALGETPRALPLVVRHTDAAREYAYDRGARRLRREALIRRWTVVDMAVDWSQMF